MKERIKNFFITAVKFIVNPRLLLCLGFGWMITNGWSYVMAAVGAYFDIDWMKWVSGLYLGFLWAPISPEKIVTVAIAIWLLKLLFPKDKNTLGVLQDMYKKAKSAIKKRKNRKIMDKNDYIAVFDSGVGGKSVLYQLQQLMPGERYLYFGDSKNAPYGTKTTDQVRRLTMAAAKKLMKKDCKALVVACNTATSAAIHLLREKYPDKVIVGIEPALKPAAEDFPNGQIGIMATQVTLREEKLAQQLERFPQATVHLIPAPGLVELIEKNQPTRELLTPILTPYRGKLDALVLGCTHYPFAAETIQELLPGTKLYDGGPGTARQTKRLLEEKGLLNDGPGETVFL